MRLPSPFRALDRFRRDRSGVSAVEFALILPILLFLYVGMIELSEGITANRKVTHAASVLADLVAQTREMSAGEIENVFDAIEAVMVPFDTTGLTMRVSSVQVDDDEAIVVCSYNRGGTALEEDDVVDLPDGLYEDAQFYVVAEIHYPYTPVFGAFLTGELDLTDTFYLRPRLSNYDC